MKFTHVKTPIIFEEIESTTLDSGSRTYAVPSPNDPSIYVNYPSVTTVTGFSKQDFFKEWRSQPGNKTKSEKATSRGNIVHDTIERYLNNDIEDFSEVEDVNHRSILNSMKPYLHKINNVHALEVPLYSHTLKIAGRVDCVAEYDGTLSIIDFKGSDKIKKEKWIENYFLQATTYAIMWEEMTGQRIDDTVIIMGNEAGFCQIFRQKSMDYVPQLLKTIRQFRQLNNMEILV